MLKRYSLNEWLSLNTILKIILITHPIIYLLIILQTSLSLWKSKKLVICFSLQIFQPPELHFFKWSVLGFASLNNSWISNIIMFPKYIYWKSSKHKCKANNPGQYISLEKKPLSVVFSNMCERVIKQTTVWLATQQYS